MIEHNIEQPTPVVEKKEVLEAEHYVKAFLDDLLTCLSDQSGDMRALRQWYKMVLTKDINKYREFFDNRETIDPVNASVSQDNWKALFENNAIEGDDSEFIKAIKDVSECTTISAFMGNARNLLNHLFDEQEEGIEVVLKRKNRFLLDTIRKHPDWEGSISKLCKKYGIAEASIINLINLKMLPYYKSKDFSYQADCMKMARLLGQPIEKLFPFNLYRHLLDHDQIERMKKSNTENWTKIDFQPNNKAYEGDTVLDIRRHNKLFKDAIRNKFSTIRDFLEAAQLDNLAYSSIITHKDKSAKYRIFERKGSKGYSELAKKVATALDKEPREIFPPSFYGYEDESLDKFGYDITDSGLTSDQLLDIVGGQITNPEQAASKESFLQLMDHELNNLTPREESVLRKRFGLDGEGGQTLEEVGQDLEVTRERIRQIQNKALRTLRKQLKFKHNLLAGDTP